VKWGIGSALGTGKQYIPWIHIDDMCEMYLFALKNNISGSFNAVSTDHVTNGEFIKAVGKASNHWVWVPKVPTFLLRLIFGEMSIVVLEGSRISNEKIKKEGFLFKYPSLNEALKNIFNKEKKN
jgi:NAD dependent epimerase/dehydratase family enzyme